MHSTVHDVNITMEYLRISYLFIIICIRLSHRDASVTLFPLVFGSCGVTRDGKFQKEKRTGGAGGGYLKLFASLIRTLLAQKSHGADKAEADKT